MFHSARSISFSCCSLFQIFDDGDLPSVRVIRAQAVQVKAAVSGQAACDRTEGEGGVSLSVLIQVGRQRPLARSHFLVDGHVNTQL